MKFNAEAVAVANFGQSKFKYNITDYVWKNILKIQEPLPEWDIKPTIFSVGDNVTDEFGHPILGKLFTVKTDITGINPKVCTFKI